MIEERSAGAVLFNEANSGKIFLLLNYPSGHWDFVKGNIEKGESLQQTVIREIREETGITDVEFIDGFEDKIEYHYQRDGDLVHKEVIFFLAKTKTTDVKISHEHLGFVWLNFDEALKKVTYKNAKDIMNKIKKLVFNT
ncbi:MAG: NUDIX domain-containing protein [Thaumarchaeota archaeon]|nr:NUDIX domain-containing protein [Nitrososphaerota archaeon]